MNDSDIDTVNAFRMGNESANLVKTTSPGWLLAIGILTAIVGLIALFSAVATTLFSVIFIGSLLVVAAIAQIVYAFKSRGWKGTLYHLAVAVLYGIAGAMLVMSPVEGAAMLTLLLALMMFASGIMRLITAFTTRIPNWGYAAFSGVVSVALAAYILTLWPVSSFVVLGVLIGIDLFFMGLYLTVLALNLPHVRANYVASGNLTREVREPSQPALPLP